MIKEILKEILCHSMFSSIFELSSLHMNCTMFKTMSQNSMYQGLLSINNLFNLGPAFILALHHSNIHPIHLPQGGGAGLPDQPEAIPSCALECLSTRVDLFRWKPCQVIIRRGGCSNFLFHKWRNYKYDNNELQTGFNLNLCEPCQLISKGSPGFCHLTLQGQVELDHLFIFGKPLIPLSVFGMPP